jgi:hypothetical protein
MINLEELKPGDMVLEQSTNNVKTEYYIMVKKESKLCFFYVLDHNAIMGFRYSIWSDNQGWKYSLVLDPFDGEDTNA